MKLNQALAGLTLGLTVILLGCADGDDPPPCTTCPETSRVFEIAQSFVSSRYDSLQLRENIDRMDIYRIDEDNLGYYHVRMNQYYHRVPVEYGALIAHVDPDLSAVHLSGRVVTEVNLNAAPDLTREEALEIATNDMEMRGLQAETFPTGELIVFPWLDNNYLCWRSILDGGLLVSEEYFVDAHTGEIVYHRNRVID